MSNNLFGRMISFTTWKKFIEASSGSEEMKKKIISYIEKKSTIREDDFIDCFAVGWYLGRLSNNLSPSEILDFEITIILTRDLNNVPIVQVDGEPVS